MDNGPNVEKNFSDIQLEVERDYFSKIVNRYEELYVFSEEEGAEGDTSEKTVLARDKKSGRLVIKKWIAREQGKIYEKLLGRVHANVVPVLDVAYTGESCIVILEYISGTSLEEKMKEQGVFSEKDAMSIMSQIACGLEFIHSFDIIHRDINPANILISSDQIVKITDLGIARSKKENQRTDTSILGTVGYAAPEQFGFAQTDVRTDIYSLGVLLNVMLTGKLPTVRIHNGKLRAVIEKAIQISPEERFQTIDEFMLQINEVSENTDSPYNANMFTNRKERAQHAAAYVFTREKTEPDHGKIPGFRTGKIWKKAVAVFFYIWMVLFTFILISDAFTKYSFVAGVLEILIMFITFWLPLIIASNWGNWKERIYPLSKMDRDLILVFRIIAPMVLFYIGITLDTWNRPQ